MDNLQKKKENKNINIGKKILLIILAFILIWFTTVTVISSMMKSKLAKIEIEQLDENQLGINDNIYNEVSTVVTEKEFDSIKNIALFGIDEGRSDTIIIASINQTKHMVKLISIPRDTYVSVEGHGKTKLNHAYAYGKETLALNTINTNFGLNISEYITINFEGLINVINKIGGIELDITKEEMDYINNTSGEEYSISGKEKKILDGYGKVMLDGEQALTHSRNRTIGHDFAREERQRKVIMAVFEKISKLGVNKIWTISDSILSEIKTNLNIEDSIEMVKKALSYSSEYLNNFVSLQIPSGEEKYGNGKGEKINGIYYYVADLEKVREALKEEIYINEENQ